MKTVKFSGRQEVFTEPEGTGQKRKICFCPTLQRPVIEKHVNELIPYLKEGWRKDRLAIVFPAEDVEKNMGKKYTLYDISGLEIPESCLGSYWLALEGQHRIKALSKGIEAGSIQSVYIDFPSTTASLRPGETLAQWLESYNGPIEKWKPSQYVSTAYNLTPDSEILQKYSMWVQRGDKTIEDSKKFPLSTLNLIYYGDSKAINEVKLKKICSGELNVPIGYNLKDGDKFIEIVTKKFSNPKHYQARYLAQGWLKIKNILGSTEKSFKVLESLTDSDIASMIKPFTKSLNPEKVDTVFGNIISRLLLDY